MYYSNYFWKDGKPYGQTLTASDAEICYKIVADPYYKRISIERYSQGRFMATIYDSLLLDFRRLKTWDDTAWQREQLEDNSQTRICILRNPDDRILFIETLSFVETYCHLCTLHSCHGLLLSTHRMFYSARGDIFDGVVLYDSEGRTVMRKHYQIDPATGEFSQLLKEEWEIREEVSAVADSSALHKSVD